MPRTIARPSPGRADCATRPTSARTFNPASSEVVTLNLGAGGSLSGAISLAAIVRPLADGTTRQALAVGTNAGNRVLRLTTGNVVSLRTNGLNCNGTTTTLLAADGWALIAATKVAGSALARLHLYKYATRTWVHEDSGAAGTDLAPTTNSVIGGVANFWNGDIAVCGAWAIAMTDNQIETLASNVRRWFEYSPNGLWLLNQSKVTEPVLDLTGKGANETSHAGTSVSLASVPLAFDLAVF